jgi:hypothetical protein
MRPFCAFASHQPCARPRSHSLINPHTPNTHIVSSSTWDGQRKPPVFARATWQPADRKPRANRATPASHHVKAASRQSLRATRSQAAGPVAATPSATVVGRAWGPPWPALGPPRPRSACLSSFKVGLGRASAGRDAPPPPHSSRARAIHRPHPPPRTPHAVRMGGACAHERRGASWCLHRDACQ